MRAVDVPEYWVDLPGTKKYQISNQGNFRKKLLKGKFRLIKPYIVKKKWLHVKVEYKGVYKDYIVHKIMADVFLRKPILNEVTYHKNGLIRDNYIDNIKWIDKKKLGKKSGSVSNCIPVLQIDVVTGEIINFYKSMAAAARDNYIHKETIRKAINGKLKTAAGYKWRKETIDENI